MAYDVNPQRTQDSITEFLRTTFPDNVVIEDGLLDDDNTTIRHTDLGVETFIVLYYSNPKPSSERGGKSFAGHRLDQRKGAVDVVVVASTGSEARRFMNILYDKAIGFQTEGGGRLTDGVALWADSRQIAQPSDRPTRWARTVRFEFGLYSQKTS